LGLTARELVGPGVENIARLVESDLLERCAGGLLERGPPETVMLAKGLAKLETDGPCRAQAVDGSLGNEADGLSSKPSQLTLVEEAKVVAVDLDRAGGRPYRGRQKTDRGEQSEALAAPRLSDEGDAVSAVDGEIEIVNQDRLGLRRGSADDP
jgi:hypothetical protein